MFTAAALKGYVKRTETLTTQLHKTNHKTTTAMKPEVDCTSAQIFGSSK